MLIDHETSPYVGLTWPVMGSRGDQYDVSLTRFGWKCNCMGFRRAKNGQCKHTTATDELLGGDHEDPVYSMRAV